MSASDELMKRASARARMWPEEISSASRAYIRRRRSDSVARISMRPLQGTGARKRTFSDAVIACTLRWNRQCVMAASSKVLTMPPCMTPAYPCHAGSTSMVAMTEFGPSGVKRSPSDCPCPQTMQSAWFAGGLMEMASIWLWKLSGRLEMVFKCVPVTW